MVQIRPRGAHRSHVIRRFDQFGVGGLAVAVHDALDHGDPLYGFGLALRLKLPGSFPRQHIELLSVCFDKVSHRDIQRITSHHSSYRWDS